MQPPGGMPAKLTLPNIGYVLVVASGKGGVGKSTVAVNLAVALQQRGTRVGLMDADIYGPSIPIMTGAAHVNQHNSPLPAEVHGLKLMSMAFVMDPHQAAILRGPMIHRYLTAFLTQINWGELDFLVIDMPPGTGDAQLSLAQTAPVSGVVTVVTPQDVSLTVARRGLEAFRQLRVPLLGIVENMSYLLGPDGQKTYIFGQGGGRKLAEQAGVPFLGEIPIDPRVAECSDAGEPVVKKYPDSPAAKAYQALAAAVVRELQNTAQAGDLPEAQL
jgi:ATP-binding protein involved in chromosome partitioning